VTDFAKSLFLKLLQLVRYQAALHPDTEEDNRKTQAKARLLEKKATESLGF
jgi:hypothetical protein